MHSDLTHSDLTHSDLLNAQWLNAQWLTFHLLANWFARVKPVLQRERQWEIETVCTWVHVHAS